MCVHLDQWVIFTASEEERTGGKDKDERIFLSLQDLKTPVCTHSGGLE